MSIHAQTSGSWRSHRRAVAACMMAWLLGCNQGPTLDEAIRGWLEVWSEAGREKCVCYHLYIDLRDPEHGPYGSEEDCLAAVIEPSDAAVDCIEAVLESGPYKTKENVEIMECYQAVEQEERTCFAENFADDCSGPPNCDSLSFSQKKNDCAGQLSDDQREAISLCRTE